MPCSWARSMLLGSGALPQKRDSQLRWAVLVLSTAALLGPYYSFDVPAATQHAMRAEFGVLDSGINSTQPADLKEQAHFNVMYNLLYSLYSTPNVILPLFGGLLTDAFGAGKLTAVLSAVVTVGAGVGYIGISIHSWPILFLGRIIFGSLESLCVSQRILVAQWFMGKELALAMGVILAVGRLGSVANDNLSVLMPLDTAYITAGFLCAASTACALVAVWIDYEYSAAQAAQRQKAQEGSSTAKKARRVRPDATPPTTLTALGARCRAVVAAMSSFDYRFWVLAVVCFTGFTSVSSFNNVAADFLRYRWAAAGHTFSQSRVNLAFSLVYLISAALASPAGYLVDHTGRRAVFTAASATVVASTHLSLAFSGVDATAMMAVLGGGFSLYAASFWPSVAYVVPPKFYGIAYGLVGCVQNSGLAIVPVLVGLLQPPACNGDYNCVLMLFAGLAGTAFTASLLLAMAEERDPSGTCACVPALAARRGSRHKPLLDETVASGRAPVLFRGDGMQLSHSASRRRSGAFSEDDRTALAASAASTVLQEVSVLLHHTAAGAMALALGAEPSVFSTSGRAVLDRSVSRVGGGTLLPSHRSLSAEVSLHSLPLSGGRDSGDSNPGLDSAPASPLRRGSWSEGLAAYPPRPVAGSLAVGEEDLLGLSPQPSTAGSANTGGRKEG